MKNRGLTYKHIFILLLFTCFNQTLANLHPYLRFIIKVNFKRLVPKSSQSSIMITQMVLMQSTNSSPTQIYPNTNMLTRILTHVSTFFSQNTQYSCMLNEIGLTQITNCKSQLWMCKLEWSNTRIPDCYSTRYSTSKSPISELFLKTTASCVIRRSLVNFYCHFGLKLCPADLASKSFSGISITHQ